MKKIIILVLMIFNRHLFGMNEDLCFSLFSYKKTDNYPSLLDYPYDIVFLILLKLKGEYSLLTLRQTCSVFNDIILSKQELEADLEWEKAFKKIYLQAKNSLTEKEQKNLFIYHQKEKKWITSTYLLNKLIYNKNLEQKISATSITRDNHLNLVAKPSCFCLKHKRTEHICKTYLITSSAIATGCGIGCWNFLAFGYAISALQFAGGAIIGALIPDCLLISVNSIYHISGASINHLHKCYLEKELSEQIESEDET